MDANATPQYSAPAWGKSPFHDLELPSGGKVQARAMDIQMLIETDLIDELDAIGGTQADEVIAPANGKRPQDRPTKKLTKKQQKAEQEKQAREQLKSGEFKAIGRILNRLIPAVVVQPRVLPAVEKVEKEGGKEEWVVIAAEDREPDVIYSDTIPLADQMFLMNWSMEGMDVEALQTFREESEQDVADVADESGVRDESE